MTDPISQRSPTTTPIGVGAIHRNSLEQAAVEVARWSAPRLNRTT